MNTATHTTGWKTSEFWLSLLGMIAGIAQTIAAPNTGVAIGGSILAAAVGAAYTNSRASVKTATVDANATIQQAASVTP